MKRVSIGVGIAIGLELAAGGLAVGCRGGGGGAGEASGARGAGPVGGGAAVIDAASGVASGAGAGEGESRDGGAAAPSTAPPSREYRAALRRGRELARKHDWRGAADAFARAVAVAPGDARALSELGWAALQAGELDRAAQASAAAAASDAAAPRVHAAALYNLGRVDEARGDRAAAIDAYRRSLALRRSRTVRRHLRALERTLPASAAGAAGGAGAAGAAGAAADPIDAGAEPGAAIAAAAPRDAGATAAAIGAHAAPLATSDDPDDAALAGPFARLDDFCDAGAALPGDDDDRDVIACLPGSGLAAGPDHLAPAPAPLVELRVLGVRGELDDVTCALAFHAATGWYVWSGVPCATTTSAGTDWATALTLEAPAPGRVLARFAVGYATRDDAGATRHACEEYAVACAVDAAPSCTPLVPVGWAASCGDPSATAPRWDVEASVGLAGDRLIVRPPARARAAPAGLVDPVAAALPLR